MDFNEFLTYFVSRGTTKHWNKPLKLPRDEEDFKNTVVNFINILRVAFAPIFFSKKIQSQTVIRENLHKAFLYKKAQVKC